MPTHDVLPRFWDEYEHLRPAQRQRFVQAVRHMIDDLHARRAFRPGLSVRALEGHEGVWEMTWAPDGRATFHYGAPIVEGEAHIVWRRIGGHEIFRQP